MTKPELPSGVSPEEEVWVSRAMEVIRGVSPEKEIWVSRATEVIPW